MAHGPHPKKIKRLLQRKMVREGCRTFCNSSNLGLFREVGGRNFLFSPGNRGEHDPWMGACRSALEPASRPRGEMGATASHAHTHIETHVHKGTQTHKHTCTQVHSHTHIDTHSHTCTHAITHTHTHTRPDHQTSPETWVSQTCLVLCTHFLRPCGSCLPRTLFPLTSLMNTSPSSDTQYLHLGNILKLENYFLST